MNSTTRRAPTCGVATAAPGHDATPRFRRIHLSHLTAREVRVAAAFLYGLAEMPLEDVTLSDVSIAMAADAEPGYADMADDLDLMQRAGIFARNARGLRLHNLEVTGQLGPALTVEDAADVEISAARAPPAGAAVLLRNRRAFVPAAGRARQRALRSKASEPGTVLRGNSLAERVSRSGGDDVPLGRELNTTCLP
jgi:hypothetical protein